MLKINGLVKRFGSFTAVDNVSFDVKRGDVLGFLGPNGAGKSTTMKMITGFFMPDEGEVFVNDLNIAEHGVQTRQLIGYLPEGAPLYGDMTPVELLEFIADIRGLSASTKKQRLDEVIQRTALQDVLNKPIEILSKGFKRRVGLAQSIIHDPDYLILDEPTDGLDPNQKYEVRQLIREMSADKVIVLSTHILEEVEAVCNRAIIIAAGKVIEDSTPAELIKRSHSHNVVELWLSHSNEAAIKNQFASIKGVKTVEIESRKQEEGVTKLHMRLLPKGKAPIIPEVMAYCSKHDIDVDSFHIGQGQLDEVFRTVTQDKQALN